MTRFYELCGDEGRVCRYVVRRTFSGFAFVAVGFAFRFEFCRQTDDLNKIGADTLVSLSGRE
jgi:hypothetical protein